MQHVNVHENYKIRREEYQVLIMINSEMASNFGVVFFSHILWTFYIHHEVHNNVRISLR